MVKNRVALKLYLITSLMLLSWSFDQFRFICAGLLWSGNFDCDSVKRLFQKFFYLKGHTFDMLLCLFRDCGF